MDVRTPCFAEQYQPDAQVLKLRSLHLWGQSSNQGSGLRLFEIGRKQLTPCCNRYRSIPKNRGPDPAAEDDPGTKTLNGATSKCCAPLKNQYTERALTSPDEQAIRTLIADWLDASAAGDLAKLRGLIAEDAVFLIPGQPPMRGREAFMAAFESGLPHFRIDATADIQEIRVVGEFAWLWNHLTVTVTPRENGAPIKRSGFTLSILNKHTDGRWVLTRDANLLTVQPPAPGG